MGIFIDLKERTLKFDTLHGLWMVPLGAAGLCSLFFLQQYMDYLAAGGVFLYFLLAGLYNLFHNPVKKQAALSRKAEKYLRPTTMAVAKDEATRQ